MDNAGLSSGDIELQEAVRAFSCSVWSPEYGPLEAARILRSLADELEALWAAWDGQGAELRPRALREVTKVVRWVRV